MENSHSKLCSNPALLHLSLSMYSSVYNKILSSFFNLFSLYCSVGYFHPFNIPLCCQGMGVVGNENCLSPPTFCPSCLRTWSPIAGLVPAAKISCVGNPRLYQQKVWILSSLQRGGEKMFHITQVLKWDRWCIVSGESWEQTLAWRGCPVPAVACVVRKGPYCFVNLPFILIANGK